MCYFLNDLESRRTEDDYQINVRKREGILKNKWSRLYSSISVRTKNVVIINLEEEKKTEDRVTWIKLKFTYISISYLVKSKNKFYWEIYQTLLY